MMWTGHVACMTEKINADKIFVGTRKKIDLFENQGVDVRILLK
jgi:hypothetical protein